MKINWKVRLKNKYFWLTIVAVVVLLLQQILGLCGVEFDAEGWKQTLTELVTTIFAALAVVGVVNDPTTEGLNDSQRALRYQAPHSDVDIDGVEENPPDSRTADEDSAGNTFSNK